MPKTNKPRVATLKVKKGPSGKAYTLLTASNGEPLDRSEMFSGMGEARLGVLDRERAYAEVLRSRGFVVYFPETCPNCETRYNPDEVDNCLGCGCPTNTKDNERD